MGASLAMVGVLSALVQTTLVGPIVRLWGEKNTLVVGTLLGSAAFFMHGIAATEVIFLLGVPLSALWGIGGAASQGLMSQYVSADEQGQLQGANSSMMGIAEMMGPLFFSGSFVWAVRQGGPEWWLGAPFFVAAFLLIPAAYFGWLGAKDAKMPENTAEITR